MAQSILKFKKNICFLDNNTLFKVLHKCIKTKKNQEF